MRALQSRQSRLLGRIESTSVRLSWLLFVVVPLSGCSVIYWPSNDEFARVDAGALESGADAGVLLPEASGDGSASDGEAGPSSLTCPANALVCDDFERDTVKGTFTAQNGMVALSTARAHSPTRSLSAIVSKGKPSPYLDASLTLPPKATLSFWFYAPTAPPSPDVNFRVAHFLWGEGCDWELSWTLFMNASEGLRMDSSVYDVAVNPSCGPIRSDGHILLNPAQTYAPTWHHVVVTMDVSQTKRRIEATIDGNTAPLSEVTSIRSTVPPNAHLAVGIPCINQNSGCFDWDGADYEVLIDDVTVVPTP